MKKKLLTVAMAAVMVVSSVLTASAAVTNIEKTTLATNDQYEEMANPLQGKNAETVTITYTINFDEAAAKNGWDGVFSFWDEASGARVSFQTAPYLCYNNAAGSYLDAKADAWCTANCEAGTEYTFKYVITADSCTVTCNGEAVEAFAVVGKAGEETYADVLAALNTYPTLSIGVGLAKSAYWNTELCEISISIDDGIAAPQTGDVATMLPVALMAVVAVAVALVAKKRTIAE